MLLSMGAGSIASVSYFITSFCLDHYVSYNLSSVVGLVVDAVLDFMLQELVFLRRIVLQKYILIKFVIGHTIFITLSLGLFNLIEPMIRENKIKKYNVLLLRVIVNFILFVLVLYPIRKYFIYNSRRFFL